MKIAMLGSVGNINRQVIPELIKANHEVTVITSNEQRVEQIEKMGAIPAVGNMNDLDFLTKTFTGKDVVYLMISGSTSLDLQAAMTEQGTIFREAITAAGVHKVVQLSSIGANDPQAGSVYNYHFLEIELEKMTDVDLAFVRPVGFYANLYSNLESIKQEQAIYSNIPANTIQNWVAPTDIANVILPLITNTPKGVSVNYAVSDEFTMNDFIEELAKQTKMTDLHFVQISDDQMKQGMLQSHVPEPIVDQLITTNVYQRTGDGGLYQDLHDQNTKYGQVKLSDFVKEYVQVLNGEATGTARTIADQRANKND